MKKAIVLTAALGLLLPAGALAQYRAGMVSLGGSLGYDTYQSPGANTTALYVSATTAFSYADKAMLGLTGTLIDYNTPYGFDNRGYTLAPFWRYNVPVAARGGVYGLASCPVVYSTDEYYAMHSWGAGLGAAFGAYYLVTEHLSAEARFGSVEYVRLREFQDGTPARWDNQLDISLTNGLGVALYYIF